MEVSQRRKKQKSLAGKDVCSGHGARGSVVSRGHCSDAGRAVEKCRPDEGGDMISEGHVCHTNLEFCCSNGRTIDG